MNPWAAHAEASAAQPPLRLLPCFRGRVHRTQSCGPSSAGRATGPALAMQRDPSPITPAPRSPLPLLSPAWPPVLAGRAAGSAACRQETHRAAILPPHGGVPAAGWALVLLLPGRTTPSFRGIGCPGPVLPARAGLADPQADSQVPVRGSRPLSTEREPRVPLSTPSSPGRLLPKDQGAGQITGFVPPGSGCPCGICSLSPTPRGSLQPCWGLRMIMANGMLLCDAVSPPTVAPGTPSGPWVLGPPLTSGTGSSEGERPACVLTKDSAWFSHRLTWEKHWASAASLHERPDA